MVVIPVHFNKALARLMTVLPALACAIPQAFAQALEQRDPNEQLLRSQIERQRDELLRQAPVHIDTGQTAQPAPGTVDTFPEGITEAGPTFMVGTIRHEGQLLLTESEFARLTRPFTGRALGVAHINVLLERINQALVAAGYITSRAYVGSQSLAQGTLTITILPGRIEQLLYNGSPVDAPGHLGVRLALPMSQGDILRLADIEQAVDQLNRLRRNNAQVQIRPGTQPGGSIVEFANTPQGGARYSATLDNHGAAATGRLRIQAAMELGNVLGLMESLNAGLSTSQDTNAVYATFAVPWGYNTFAGMASYSEYQNLVGDAAIVFGTTRSYTLSFNRLIARDQHSKTAVDLSLSRRASSRAINNATLAPQAQTVLRAGVNRLARFSTRHGLGQWTVDGGVSRGLRALGASRDGPGLPPEAARYDFTKLEISGSLERPVTEGSVWRSRAAAQWSRRPLYSSEQIFAGGVGSVRGFAESALGGDKGAWWRNEWAWQKASPLWQGRLRYEPYLFLDGARLATLSDHRTRTLLGAGAGLRVAHAKGYAEIVLGKPLRHPQDMTDTGWRLHLSVAHQF